MAIFVFFLIITSVVLLLSYLLGKFKKYIRVNFKIKTPIISTSFELEAGDKK